MIDFSHGPASACQLAELFEEFVTRLRDWVCESSGGPWQPHPQGLVVNSLGRSRRTQLLINQSGLPLRLERLSNTP